MTIRQIRNRRKKPGDKGHSLARDRALDFHALHEGKDTKVTPVQKPLHIVQPVQNAASTALLDSGYASIAPSSTDAALAWMKLKRWEGSLPIRRSTRSFTGWRS